jgi:tRNA-specific 2-thiouridylase
MPVEVIGDSARGDDYALVRLVVEGDRIVEADAPGMARPLEGLTLLEAAAVPGDVLAADALAGAIADALNARPGVSAAPVAGRIAVAMSGGVDSAVALHRAGRAAVGVTLRLWLDPAGPGADRACCSPDAVIRARQACHALELPHITLDLRDDFRGIVVRSFVEGYAAGLTPNPCMRCNGEFRFDALVSFACRVGASILWTGHYARVVERDGVRLVARGLDATKDQSYMLATVDPALLDRVAFPLGTTTKEAVRAEAVDLGLEAAGRRESQEACFLAGGDYRSFLERQGVPSPSGKIVDESGTVIGSHTGLWRFTPGLRRGLGLVSPEPLHVVRSDRGSNTLVVGPRSSLGTRIVSARGSLYLPVDRADAKLRYRSRPVGAAVLPVAGGFELELDEPVEAIAPGQVAALYDGDAIVGAGVIESATG